MTDKENLNADIIEKIAELEHEQWMTWSKSVCQEVSEDRRKRWKKLWVPYKELSEEDKEKDRVWARRVLRIISRTDVYEEAYSQGRFDERIENYYVDILPLETKNKHYRKFLEYMLKRTREAMKKYGDRNSEEYNFERYNECSFYEDMLEQALEGKNERVSRTGIEN